MKRTAVRVGQAGVTGVLIGVAIGLGAYNAWWVAVLVSIPLIVAGLAIAPRPSRTSELPVFTDPAHPQAVPVRVDALARSSRTDDDLQPTLVSATISPPHDTEYRARWIASMSRDNFRSLTENPLTALPPDQLPEREDSRTPGFDDHPGTRAAIYPLVAILVALTVLFGVGEAWRIPFDRPESPAPQADTATTSKTMNFNARRNGMIRAIAEQFGPAATNNLLDLRLTGSGSDYGTVLDPTNGDATTVYINNRGDVFTTPSPRVLRKDSTFTAAEISSTDLDAIAENMARNAGMPGRRGDLEIKRSAPGTPVTLTGNFGGRTIDGLPDGTVGEIFDPADFTVSFDRARKALALAGIAPSDRALTNFEIRGTHRATPTAHASELQSSGGVLLDFDTGDRSGQIVIVPGELPEVTDESHHSQRQTFAFDDINLQVFESVRAQAMQRGALEPYEREAVEIWLTDREIDQHRLAIRIELAGVDAATGTYSLAGAFLAPGAI
ncbi:hypothetical protein VST63_05205 [Mycolicibacterium sp. 050232]|uniref:hypothetical protein n=1 Tax=Mycolicibacterium sp. 050232 TaxID=3113982 RepID=UPI002E299698|nr:hypothetical protein [Mycolicibacterium sp. 050232]MED5811751.1 hypothetical protein [Mycolicibacterium sp. 050232]